jgi:hypothetical protein
MIFENAAGYLVLPDNRKSRLRVIVELWELEASQIVHHVDIVIHHLHSLVVYFDTVDALVHGCGQWCWDGAVYNFSGLYSVARLD